MFRFKTQSPIANKSSLCVHGFETFVFVGGRGTNSRFGGSAPTPSLAIDSGERPDPIKPRAISHQTLSVSTMDSLETLSLSELSFGPTEDLLKRTKKTSVTLRWSLVSIPAPIPAARHRVGFARLSLGGPAGHPDR
jgi:hypothetical protein